MKRLMLLFFCLCMIFCGSVFAEDIVTLATLEWEPYIGSNMQNNGYVFEIVEEAF